MSQHKLYIYIYIYILNVLATFVTYLEHIILNVLNCSMRTDGRTGVALLTVALRNFANTPKSTIVRTNILFWTYVQFSQICLCPVDTCYRQTATAVRWLPSAAPARPLLNRNNSTSLPSGSRTVAHNTCSLNTLQYCSGPCRNIWRRWTANCCDV